MQNLATPSELLLQGNIAESWRKWRRKFENYLIAVDIHDPPRKAALFLHCAGEEVQEIVSQLQFPDGKSKDVVEDLIEQMELYCNPWKDVVYEHFLFWKMEQNETNIDQFVVDLRTQARNCEFSDQEDYMIRDRVVLGCSNVGLQEHLLRETNVSLKKAIEICRSSEVSKMQIKHLAKPKDVMHVQKAVSGSGITRTAMQGRTGSKCSKCGMIHKFNTCPAYGRSCYNCGIMNHFSKVCKKPQRRVNEINTSIADGEIFHLDTVLSESGMGLFQSLQVGEQRQTVIFKLDTGAEVNVIPWNVFSGLGGKLAQTTTRLTGYGNVAIQVKGESSLKVTLNGEEFQLSFIIADVDGTPILGLKSCEMLNLVHAVREVKCTKNNDGTFACNKKYIFENYTSVFSGVGKLSDKHMYKITVDKDVTPVVHTCRRVPFKLHARLQSTLDSMEANGIISKVDKPTDWVNSLVIVEKKDGSLRPCLDPTDLNKAIKREHYHSPSIDEITSKLCGKTIFSIVDLKNGYWAVPLDEESSYLTTFNTPFSRYRFHRLAFGLNSAAEVFQRTMERVFGDIPNVHVFYDDLIVAGKDEEEHNAALQKLLNRAEEENVKFNIDKLQLCVPEVAYVGKIISAQGIKPDPNKINAILEMQTPTDKPAVQRLLGMVNYLSEFIPNVSEMSAPLRKLLKRNQPWEWATDQETALDAIKDALVNEPVLKYFDPKEQVTLQTDASQNGLGCALLQNDQPVAYASRSLTPAEKNYAQIEKELLAILFACERFHPYVYGQDVQVQCDHKPIEMIMKKSISKASPRLQRMLLRLQRYTLKVIFKPGKEMYLADTLSRAYITTQGYLGQDVDIDEDPVRMIHTIYDSLSVSEEIKQTLITETKNDATLQLLERVIHAGWPKTRRAVDKDLQDFWNIRDELFSANGLVFFGSRILVPESLRKEMLLKVHGGHFGIEKCKSRARQLIYWPNINKDIEETVSRCATCNKFQRRQSHEPLHQHEVPELPWQVLASDTFQWKGKLYMIAVDYYSKYPEVYPIRNLSAEELIDKFKDMFARHGHPQCVVADNMPYNSKEMRSFGKEYGFDIKTSSPMYPRSNGMAERAVQTIKNLLKKADENGEDHRKALLVYRDSPISGVNASPAQLLMSRNLRCNIPKTFHNLKPEVVRNVKEKLIECQHVQKKVHDRRSTRPLAALQSGENVRIRTPLQKTWEPAKVVEKHSSPRSYIVRTTDGETYRRNRAHLRQSMEDAGNFTVQPAEDVEGWSDEAPTATGAVSGSASMTNMPPRSVCEQEEPIGVALRRSTRARKQTVRFGYDTQT